MYRLLRPLLFAVDPETVHHATLAALSRAAANPSVLATLSGMFQVRDERLEVTRFGLRFPNPVGLAAGMDKDGVALRAWEALGFGFTEAGSVTAEAQPGNPRPRLFRLQTDRAIVNRMGFNNEGAAALAERLAGLRQGGVLRTPLLVNVGKSRVVRMERAADDYRRSLQTVWPHADGVVINVSSPNTPGLRSLQDPGPLAELLSVGDGLQALKPLPLLLKVAPDLEDEQLVEIARLAEAHRVAGIVAVNTTITREGLASGNAGQQGGLSGKPLAARALAVLRLLARSTALPIVSVGGIFTAADAIARLRAGASLVELYTGFVYGGPGTVRSILRGILDHLDREGIPNVESLIGADLRD